MVPSPNASSLAWPAFEGVVEPGSTEFQLLEKIDPDRLPRHIAVIMDGNGRWANQRGLSRIEGHRAGADSVRESIETSARLGIQHLTLYAFSVENWKRPKTEVNELMRLLKKYLQDDLPPLLQHNIRFKAIGRTDQLDPTIQLLLRDAERKTAGNQRLQLNLALNYGGRTELVDAARHLARRIQKKELRPDDITEDVIAAHLYTAGLPDPDLLIRTSGEQRVSNFLLWQIAYAEFHITPVLWPDFRKRSLFEAVIEFQARDRRYGGLSEK